MGFYQHLSSKIQAKMAPFFERGAYYNYSPDSFLQYLDTIFADPHRRQVAMTELEQIEQRATEPFSDFLVRFEAKLELAGGAQWADEIKVMRLRRALSLRLKQCCVGRDIPLIDYPAAVLQIRSIAVEIESFELEAKFRQKGTQPAAVVRQDEDTSMTGVNLTSSGPSRPARGRQPNGGNRTQQQRATWVSDDTIQARRTEGSCLRCDKLGHRVRDCWLLPAIRDTQKSSVNTTETIRAGGVAEQGGKISGNEAPPQ